MKFFIPCFLLLLSFSGLSQGQSSTDDFSLIQQKQQNRISEMDQQQQQTGSFTLGRNAFERYNPVSLLLAGSLRTYSSVISPQLGSNCIYHTSCSVFSRQAISEAGLADGILLTADRISRCNRIAGSDTPFHRIDEETGLIRDEVTRYTR